MKEETKLRIYWIYEETERERKRERIRVVTKAMMGSSGEVCVPYRTLQKLGSEGPAKEFDSFFYEAVSIAPIVGVASSVL